MHNNHCPLQPFIIMFKNLFSCRTTSTVALILLLFLSPCPTKASPPANSIALFADHPKYEVRAVWLTTIKRLDWPRAQSVAAQKQELCDILDALYRANINTVLFQARIRATTCYPSNIEPFDAIFSSSFDALQFAIDECHKRGMELHAWMVTLPCGQWTGQGCRHLRNIHPELMKKIGDEGYLNPEVAGTADYLSQLVDEVVSRYDVDGIHLDYIRYPETWKAGSASASARRENITNIVRKIHTIVKQQKPWVKVSASPVGKYQDLPRYSSRGWNAFTAVAQDAQAWAREGIVDQLYPMMYFKDNQFFPFALDWLEGSGNCTIVPGLGIYFLHPSEGKWQLRDIPRQLVFLRQKGMGYALFRSRFFTDNTKGLYTYIADRHAPYPALIPPMHNTPANGSRQPTPVSRLIADVGSEGIVLKWNHPTKDILFNVYADSVSPVNTDDVRNIIAVRTANRSIVIPRTGLKRRTCFAVAAVDRYGYESTATQLMQPTGNYHGSSFIKTNGKVLQLPRHLMTGKERHVLITDMTGRRLHRVPVNHETTALNISRMPEGMYGLALADEAGMKNITYFTIRRKAAK